MFVFSFKSVLYLNINRAGSHWISYLSNVFIFALENEFSEIICIKFEKKQNIFSTIFGTKFVVICAAKILQIGQQIKILCPKLILNRDFAYTSL